MAVFVASSTATTGGSASLTIPLPAGVMPGDLLVATIAVNDHAETITVPSGWVAVAGSPLETGTMEGGVWYKIHTSDTVDPTWGVSAIQKITGAMVAYRGVDANSPITAGEVGTRSALSQATTAPGVVTSAADQVVLGIFTSKTTDVTSVDVPTGMTMRAERFNSGGGATTAHIFSQVIAEAGDTGPRTLTYDAQSTSSYGILIALNDSSSGPGPGSSVLSLFTGWGIPLVLAPPVLAAKYPGDPGDGKYYIGWAEYSYGTSAAKFQSGVDFSAGYPGSTSPGLGVWHSYGASGSGNMNVDALDFAINQGVIASNTFKIANYSQAQVAAGNADALIDSFAEACIDRAPWPIWLCYYHEPEGDVTPADYRAAYRRIVQRFRSVGVTNVAWMPILMAPWSFGGSGGPQNQWREYHADWTGSGWHDDITMDLFGVDVYSPMPGGSYPYGFQEIFEEYVFPRLAASNAPDWDIVLPEFGMGHQASPLPDWEAWASEVPAYAKANKIKAFMYWDNSTVDRGRYTLDRYAITQPGYDPSVDADTTHPKKLNAWRTICNQATAFEPPG